MDSAVSHDDVGDDYTSERVPELLSGRHWNTASDPLTALPRPPNRPANAQVSSLARIARDVATDTSGTWMLVVLVAALGGAISFMGFWAVADTILPEWLWEVQVFIGGLLALVVLGGPAAYIGSAVIFYRKRYKEVKEDLIGGWAALALVDCSYGEQIEMLRQQRYRPIPGMTHLGTTLPSRLTHFAAFYPYYRELSRGPAEPAVPSPPRLACWLDGLALLTCVGVFLLPLIAVRVLLSYPRAAATKRAVLDFFQDKWDDELEQQWSSRRECRL